MHPGTWERRSTGQANAMRKLLEAWVGAQRIEARPYQHTWVKSFCVAFFEPIHRFVHIPKRHIDHRNLRRMRIARCCTPLQLAQQLDRFAPAARQSIGASKISGACRASSRKLDRFLEF